MCVNKLYIYLYVYARRTKYIIYIYRLVYYVVMLYEYVYKKTCLK
jgi:hypothetical protein